MPFRIEDVGVERDEVQGLYANRVPLDDPDMIAIIKLRDELIQDGEKNPNSLIYFGPFEIGGADPQVRVEYGNRDFAEPYRRQRKEAPNTPLRPLFRGSNAFLLSPIHQDDLRHLLTHMAQDIATQSSTKPLLRVKIFDSQGKMDETESTVQILSELYTQGYPVSVELAIPYSKKGNIYPDELYLHKVEEAYRLLTKYRLPLNECRISLKDMVGQLDEAAAQTLIPKIIAKLKALQQETGTEIPLGLHLHNTGLATKAYVAAIKACKDNNYPITIDTVESLPFKAEYIGKDAWRNTGFTSLLEVDAECQKQGIDLGLTPFQREKLQEMAKINTRLSNRYAVRRVEPLFDDTNLQEFDIPGGGFSTYSTAVENMVIDKKKGLHKILDISRREALLIAGYALNEVGALMGHPFAVTPGFQNKQIAALNLIKNMIEKGMIKSGMSIDEIKAVIAVDEWTDEDVDELFLKNLSPVVREFLKGEMPAETMQKLGINSPARIHPRIREVLGKRTTLLTDTATLKLPEAIRIVDELYAQGLLKATDTQENTEEKIKQTHITWALELGDPKKLRAAIEKPWLHEPNPSDFENDKQGYLWAIEKSKKGKNPQKDALEKRFEQVKKQQLSIEKLDQYTNLLLQKERMDMWQWVLGYIEENPKLTAAALSGDIRAIEHMVEHLYGEQIKLIQEKENKGESFLFFTKRRLDIVLDFYASALNRFFKHETINFHAIVNAKRKSIEETIITAFAPGTILEIAVQPNESVKAGQPIGTIFAMKQEMTITADKDGVIESIAVKIGDPVEPGKVIMTYKQVKAELTQSQHHNYSHMHDADMASVRYVQSSYTSKAQKLDADLKAAETQMDKETAIHQQILSEAESRGVFSAPLSLTDAAKQGHENEIHIIGNRGACEAKLWNDFRQANLDIRLLTTPEDQFSPLISNATEAELIRVDSYTSHRIIINMLREMAAKNPGKKIFFHPGWGFLSEVDEFVAKVEALKAEGILVEFVGPPSNAMRITGGKKTFRDLVNEVAADYNPPYVGNPVFTAKEIQTYIDGQFQPNSTIDTQYRAVFENVSQMRNVMIKAIAGGGGMGIEQFIYDESQSKEANYRRYMALVLKNADFSERTFGNGEMLTEQCINGKTRHLEVQLIINHEGAIVLGPRDCTAQKKKQKTNEVNVIQGDYPPDVMSNILLATKKVGDAVAKTGYLGALTIEMMLKEDGDTYQAFFLEGNTRIQVEHGVTEEDLRLKTEKNISIPLLNLACIREPNAPLRKILERDFNFTDANILSAAALGNERIEHIRLNSMEVDFLSGKLVPSYFWGFMWPGNHVIDAIAKKTGAKIIMSDIGDGNYNAQTGTVWGTKTQVMAAVKEIQHLVEIARTCIHHDGTLSVDAVLAFNQLIYNQLGNFNPEFSTKFQDEFIQAIKDGKVKMPLDMQALSMTPAIQEGGIQKAFAQFLSCKAEEARAQASASHAFTPLQQLLAV